MSVRVISKSEQGPIDSAIKKSRSKSNVDNVIQAETLIRNDNMESTTAV